MILTEELVPGIYETTVLLFNMIHLSMLMWRGEGRLVKGQEFELEAIFGSNALPQGGMDLFI